MRSETIAIHGGYDIDPTTKDIAAGLGEVVNAVGGIKAATNMFWTLITGFLVMFMQARFALVEAGLCRAKHVAHTMAMNFMIYALGMLGFYFVGFALMFGGCNIVKKESKAPTLLKTEEASQAELMNEVNRFARVGSMRAKMDLKFEDNSFAVFGQKEVYRTADGDVTVERPGRILLKVQVPVIKSEVV